MSGLVAFFFCASTPYRLLRTEHMRASATLSDNTARQSWPSLVMNGHTQRNSASQPETSAILPSQAPYTRTHKAVSAGTRTFPISGRRPSHVKEPIAISALPSQTHARRSFKPLVRNTWHHAARSANPSLCASAAVLLAKTRRSWTIPSFDGLYYTHCMYITPPWPSSVARSLRLFQKANLLALPSNVMRCSETSPRPSQPATRSLSFCTERCIK